MSGKLVGRVAGGLLAVVMLLIVMALPNPAFAHAALIKTDPADGAVLAQGPAQFSLTFSEPVSPLVLTLVKPDGTPIPLTSFRLSDQTVEIDNPQTLGSGTHVLSWRVISADGHPVGGSLLFSIGAPTRAAGRIRSRRLAAAVGDLDRQGLSLHRPFPRYWRRLRACLAGPGRTGRPAFRHRGNPVRACRGTAVARLAGA